MTRQNSFPFIITTITKIIEKIEKKESMIIYKEFILKKSSMNTKLYWNLKNKKLRKWSKNMQRPNT